MEALFARFLGYNHEKAVTHFNLQSHGPFRISEALWTANNILFTSCLHVAFSIEWILTVTLYLFI